MNEIRDKVKYENFHRISTDIVIILWNKIYAIDKPVHVSIKSKTLDTTFRGIHVVAQDENNLQIGYWKINNRTLNDNSCGDGLIYKSEETKISMDAVWQVSSSVAGNIALKITVIENDNTIYVNCYNFILQSRVSINSSSIDDEDSASNETTTTTTPSPTSKTTTVSPTSQVTVNVTWTFTSGINVTNVLMSITNLKTRQWTAIGFGQNQKMGESHVFICKRLSNDTIVINRYVNPEDHDPPEPAGSEQGGIFTPGLQLFKEGVVTCQFNLSNFTTQTFGQLKTLDPLSQSRQYHPLIAIGVLDIDAVTKHSSDSRIANPELVQLNQNGVVLFRVSVVTTDLTFVRTHGIIMIFTWILIVSTGALISRYFKISWANKLICGKAAWFAAHRFLMSMAAVLTTIGFLFILVFLRGTWIDQGPTRPYAHSITGVLVISLAFFQPFIALFRCEPDSRYRFIFNYIHAFFGFSAFILSTAALYLATYFHVFKDSKGRIVIITWIGWVVLVFLIFECIEFYIRKKNRESGYTNINTPNTTISDLVEHPTAPKVTLTSFGNEQEISIEQKSKNILLAIHILVAATLSIILTTLIL
ncbi:hypothetical protein I4U23_029231 [Adineta vaga]|nr:hypothetical protein I4U23_029231 [Adineta vaga]